MVKFVGSDFLNDAVNAMLFYFTFYSSFTANADIDPSASLGKHSRSSGVFAGGTPAGHVAFFGLHAGVISHHRVGSRTLRTDGRRRFKGSPGDSSIHIYERIFIHFGQRM